MKKLLLLCLLGGVCLFSNTLRAQARVADSPGTNFLHRFMSLRGGETRSDPYSEGFSLVDDSNSLRQGRGTSPAASGAVIWGMVSDYSGMEEVELMVFQDFFFDSPKAPLSNRLTIPLKKGNLMEGAYPKDKSFQYQLGELERPVWFRLSLKNALPFLNRFVIEPGDSVQVFADTQRLSVVFGGPDADKFRLQYQLQQVQNEVNREMDPILWTGNPKAVLADSSRRRNYQEALEGAGPVLQVKDQKTEQLPYLQGFDPWANNGLLERSFKLIEGYRGVLEDDFLELMQKEAELKVWATHLSGITSSLTYAQRSGLSEMETGLKELANLRLAELSEILTAVSVNSSAMMDLLDARTKLWVASKGVGYRKAISLILEGDGFWREKYAVRILYDKYQGLEDAESILDDALHSKEGGYSQLLTTLQSLTGVGVPVRGFDFKGEAGESYGIAGLPDAEIYLVEFWITGCKVCVAFNELTLSKVKEHFGQDTRLQVVTVSADFEEQVWKKSLASGKYTQAGFTNLYTGPINRKHPFLLEYGISSFPNRILMDGKGRILQMAQVPFRAEELIPLLENYLSGSTETESQL